MAYRFPSEEYLHALVGEINNDDRYAEMAKNWEGDLLFVIEPDEEVEAGQHPLTFYMDLWHGSCRQARVVDSASENPPEAAFTLRAPRVDFIRVLNGELDVMQALITRKLNFQGSMPYMMRNVPVLLDFVRVCRKVEIEPDSE